MYQPISEKLATYLERESFRSTVRELSQTAEYVSPRLRDHFEYHVKLYMWLPMLILSSKDLVDICNGPNKIP